MAELDGKIRMDGTYLRFGEVILNRIEVAEARLRTGVVLMRSGASYQFPPEVLQCWFADVTDYKPPFDRGLLSGVKSEMKWT